jgi:hypothetical protein
MLGAERRDCRCSHSQEIKMMNPKKPSFTWVFSEGVLIIHHFGKTVSLGRYATRQLAAKAAAAYRARQRANDDTVA